MDRQDQWRLVVVDLDGTLIPGTSVARHLDSRLGSGKVIAGMEPRLASGELSNRQIAEAYAQSYRDVALARVLAALADIPALTDVGSGVEMLRERQVDALIATTGWAFGAQALAQRWRFAGSCGVELEVDGASGRFTGQVQRHLEPRTRSRG